MSNKLQLITSQNLSPIVSAFQNNTRGCLFIKKTEESYSIEVRTLSIWESLFPCFRQVSPEHSTTLQCLKELIGEARLKRIFQKEELELSESDLNKGSLFLTEDVVQRIFLGMGDIRIEDLHEHSVDMITTTSETYRSLLPVKKIADLFFNRVPQIGPYDNPKSSGKGYEGLRERVWTILSHTSRENEFHFATYEMLTSRLADREVPVGTVLRIQNTYYVCEKIFAAGGAYITLFRDTENKATPFLLCRGTAARWSATEALMSIVNDLLFDIGSYGFNSIRDELLKYLQDHQIEHISVLGKSLGGAYAKYIATFLSNCKIEVLSLILTCSVGVSDYAKEMLEKLAIPTKIIRTAGKLCADYIPLVGGSHPYHAETRLYYISPDEEDDAEVATIPTIDSTISKIWNFIRSFGKGHNYQVTLGDYKIRKVMGEDLKNELQRGMEMEGWRLLIAKIFNFLTFGYFNQPLRLTPES